MSSPNKIYKDTLSCRLNPYLKKQIQDEASEKRLTTSNYIESILKKRNWILTEEERSNIIYENQHLEAVIQSLNHELEEEQTIRQSISEALDQEHKLLHSKLEEIQHLKQQVSKIKKGSILFNEDQLEELQKSVQKLKKTYSEVEVQDLVLASFKASLKNEESVLYIHLIKGHLK